MFENDFDFKAGMRAVVEIADKVGSKYGRQIRSGRFICGRVTIRGCSGYPSRKKAIMVPITSFFLLSYFSYLRGKKKMLLKNKRHENPNGKKGTF